MKRIPQSTIDEILARVPIGQVIGDYVKLQRKGTRMLGLCPFHDEKTPSFSVNPDRGLYHCFGCGASGNTVSFLMQHDGLSFREAMEQLAARAGVRLELEQGDPERERRDRDRRQALLEANAFARDLFSRALWSGRWEAPVAYLEERGISREVAERFELGYAPPEWSALVDAAGRAGLGPQWLEAAGLAMARRQGGGYIDRFRDRIMFPVTDLSRRVLAFSGRTLDPGERAKYINTSETEIYVKGRNLYGLPLAQRSIRSLGEVILVEGNFDVVSLHAGGFDRTCAALGTALTEEQARLLRRFADRVLLLYDGDVAGRKAARKALEVLLAEEVPDVRIVRLPEGRDPDDVVRSEGAEALQALLDEARPMVDVLLDEAIAPAAGAADATSRRGAVTAVVDVLYHVRDPVLRDAWVRDCSRRLQVDARRLDRYVRERSAGRPQPGADPSGASRDRPLLHLSAHESMLVEALADEPALLGRLYREELFRVLPTGALASYLEEVSREWVEEGGRELRTHVGGLPEDSSLRRALTGVLAGEGRIAPGTHQRVFDEVGHRLKRSWLDRELRRTQEALRRLGGETDGEAYAQLMERSRDLLSWLQRLDPHQGRP